MLNNRIYLAAEDELSATLGEILVQAVGSLQVFNRKIYGGKAQLKGDVEKFLNMASNGIPVLIVTDLDAVDCAPALIAQWFPNNQFPFQIPLMFRIAVREAEAWVLADRAGSARKLGVSPAKIPKSPDTIVNPKRELINLVAGGRSRQMQLALLPAQNSTAKVGPEYNTELGDFLRNDWDLDKAMQVSDSLKRAHASLRQFATSLHP